ncbi:MAG: DUF3427 domain-containing protein, partial [Chloroflexi bacterium]|nr:DUF3427 domain-containing protein [Chloroflexota bacterium]
VTQIRGGFPFLPAGCHMELDAIAQERVLVNIRQAIPATLHARVAELRSFGRDVDLKKFLDEAGLDLSDVYAHDSGWSDLRQRAGLSVLPAGTDENALRRSVSRLLHIDDDERLAFYARLLTKGEPPDPSAMDDRSRRLLRMLIIQVLSQVATRTTSLADGCTLLWSHPQVMAELREVIAILGAQRSHLTRPLLIRPTVPLHIHASYARSEILASFGVGDGAHEVEWREGVRWLPHERTDVFLVTADKTTGHFSPTTRYRDHAMSRTLFHWESQSRTASDSPTGQRYRTHEANGSDVMLFARHRQDHRAFVFLGPASYVRHESERPMQVTWRLHVPIPADAMGWLAMAA